MDVQPHMTPGMIAGAVQPDGSRIVSPEAQDVLDRLRAHYQSMGKAAAASNYNRHLRSLFAWAENHGHSVRTLPADAVETFLGDLRSAGQKEATIHVMRTQIKSALREAHNALGVDFAHLEYQTGKPREVRRAQREREKAKKQEKRLAQTIAQAQAIMAAQASGQPLPRPDMPVPEFVFNSTPAPVIDFQPVPPAPTPEEHPMSTASAPASEGTMASGSAAPQQPVVVVQMPPQNQRANTATIGAAKPAGQQTTTVGRGMTINSHTFSGPYIRISRMADGTDPLTPPGTETYITTVPLTQLQPHGDAAAYLQSFILPNLRLAPTVGQVHFTFHELNDRRQPTGRRDELVVSVPMGMASPAQMPVGQQAPQALGGLPMGGSDNATNYLLRKLDEDASSAKRRADELQEKLRTEKDSQNMFLLMQQFQKEQDLRRELENQRQQAMAQMQQMQMMSMAPPPMPMPVIDPPKPDASAEMVRALAENQAKMMESMMAGMRQPPPPQKDAAEWLMPFIAQMNQQAQAQQQANQQMLVGIMQANQQFMQALLTRENPTEKLLFAQLQEAKAEARAPKGDEMEDFAEKLQKMKMVSDMLGGGGGGASSVLGELLSNAEAIGEGAAKIIAATKNNVTLPAAPTGPQLAGAPNPQALPAGQPATPPGPPPAVIEALGKLEEAAKKADDQEVVTEVVNIIRHLIDAGMPAAGMGNRLLTAFKEMDDEAEMFTFAKSMWIVAGKKADKKLAKVVAAILTKWYTDIHEQLFGNRRAIGEEVIEEPEIDSDEDDDDDSDADESEAEGAEA